MNFHKCNMHFTTLCAGIALLFFGLNTSFSQQNDDSLLLQKVENIEVSLNSIDSSDEDLYDNPVSFQTFYDDLSDDGEWIMITKEEIEDELNDGDGQGFASDYVQEDGIVYIWKPSITEEGWRPYMNGRWVYTTNGWLWVSNYRWGWACYHYGRWLQSKEYGWVWMPGYVWAPAWVKWRISENHIGWCPLSPKAKWDGSKGITISSYNYESPGSQWVFVDKGNFVSDLDKSKIVSVNENLNLIRNSEAVLNMKYENGRLHGKGPDVKDIEKRTGKVINAREIKLKQERGRSLVGDNSVSVYRERFKRHEVDKSGKMHKLDKPKKFRKSPKAKKIYKKIKIKRRNPPHRIH